MSWKFFDVAAVEAQHEQQIVRFGGSHGLRDAGLLESAVVRAENKANYDSEATVAGIAASLGWGLINNHAFIDGKQGKQGEQGEQANWAGQYGRVPEVEWLRASSSSGGSDCYGAPCCCLKRS